jgi:hypothetical protein
LTWEGSRLPTLSALPRWRAPARGIAACAVPFLALAALVLAGWAAGWFRPAEQKAAEAMSSSANHAGGASDEDSAVSGAGKADDPNLLTVSQKPEDGGKYRTIGAAPPEGVEPWDWDRAWRTGTKAKGKKN